MRRLWFLLSRAFSRKPEPVTELASAEPERADLREEQPSIADRSPSHSSRLQVCGPRARNTSAMASATAEVRIPPAPAESETTDARSRPLLCVASANKVALAHVHPVLCTTFGRGHADPAGTDDHVPSTVGLLRRARNVGTFG